jgi:RNA polymerase sigma factor for flagellar operon FliA
MKPAGKLLHFPKSQRDAVIEEHLPLVEMLARVLLKGLPPCFEFDDLVQEGCLGLMLAADSFDRKFRRPGHKHNVPFTAWARKKINFAMLDSIRRRNYTANTMEALHSQADQRYSGHAKITNFREGGGEDTQEVTAALAAHTGNPEVELNRAIDEPRKLFLVAKAISQLPERKRKIFELYYRHNQPLAEAANVLGIDDSRASQLHHEGLRELSCVLGRFGVRVDYQTLRDGVAVRKPA